MLCLGARVRLYYTVAKCDRSGEGALGGEAGWVRMAESVLGTVISRITEAPAPGRAKKRRTSQE